MVEVHEFFRVIRHRAVVVVLLTAVGVAAAAVWVARAPDQYVATTRLFISAGTSTSQYDAQQGGIYAQDRVVSYENLINSRALAQRTINALALDLDADKLAADVTSKTVPNSAVMDVSVSAASPQRAKDIANGLAQQFVAMAAALETPPDGTTPAVRVNIIDSADNGIPSRAMPNSLIYILGGLIGFIAGVLIGFLFERFSGRVRDRVDVERATGEQPTAELPASRDELLPISRPESIEAIHRLRLATSGSNVVAVTGLSGKAAKSTRGFAAATAARLAASFGAEGESTTLVVLDPDPGVASRVGRLVKERGAGGPLADVKWSLAEDASRDYVVLNPSTIAERLQRLQSEFQRVVVLIPAPTENAQAAAVASVVQGVVGVGVYNRSTVGDLQRHDAEALRNGANSLGVSFVRRRLFSGSSPKLRTQGPAQSADGAKASVPPPAQPKHSVASGVSPIRLRSRPAT